MPLAVRKWIIDRPVNLLHRELMPRVSNARKKLMDAAQMLIWERSYGATSVDDICAKAAVQKGSFYYFFKSKSDLAVAALDTDWQTKKVRYNEIFSATVPPLQRLESYFAMICERQGELQKKFGSVLGCPYCTVGTEVGLQDASIREKVQEILDGMRKYIESAIRDAHAQGEIHAPDEKKKAELLFAYFQGTMTQARIENNLTLLCGMYAGALELLGASQPEASAA